MEDNGTSQETKKLVRTQDGRMLAGVCSGIARYFQVDATIVRVLWVLITCLGGAGLLAYLICWLVIPEE